MGLHEGLMLLKDFPNLLRPNRTCINKQIFKINQRKKQLNNKGNLEGPIPYGITWRLRLLTVLHKPPRPIRVYMPKSKEKWGIITIIKRLTMNLKQRDYQGSNTLWDYMEVNAIESLT
jgi:hypothetical protein